MRLCILLERHHAFGPGTAESKVCDGERECASFGAGEVLLGAACWYCFRVACIGASFACAADTGFKELFESCLDGVLFVLLMYLSRPAIWAVGILASCTF